MPHLLHSHLISIPESNPDADPREDAMRTLMRIPIDYHCGWRDEERMKWTLRRMRNDDMDIEADEYVLLLPATAPSAEETDPFETDESAATPPPHPAYRMTARISIPEPLPVPTWSDSEVANYLLYLPTSTPLSPWSQHHHIDSFPMYQHTVHSPVLTHHLLVPKFDHWTNRAGYDSMKAEAASYFLIHNQYLPPFILSPTRPVHHHPSYISSNFIPTTIITH
ncbi:hypothetical protein Tco_0908056 [Tanacetum coccineum]|uniref:Uncharacterized protein n=1 Tax=Tanacetum coccineum TaxID=301880 RepID=A0ABQ5CPJ9_9ASTR